MMAPALGLALTLAGALWWLALTYAPWLGWLMLGAGVAGVIGLCVIASWIATGVPGGRP